MMNAERTGSIQGVPRASGQYHKHLHQGLPASRPNLSRCGEERNERHVEERRRADRVDTITVANSIASIRGYVKLPAACHWTVSTQKRAPRTPPPTMGEPKAVVTATQVPVPLHPVLRVMMPRTLLCPSASCSATISIRSAIRLASQRNRKPCEARTPLTLRRDVIRWPEV